MILVCVQDFEIRCAVCVGASEASDAKIETQKGDLVVMNRCDDMEFFVCFRLVYVELVLVGVICVRGRD